MPNDEGCVIFLVNILLISCNTNVQQDTEMALKLEYIKAALNKCWVCPCPVSLRLARAPAHIQKKATEYTEKEGCDIFKESSVLYNKIFCFIHFCFILFKAVTTQPQTLITW